MTGVAFGVFVVPDASGREAVVGQVERADRAGLDLVGIQDHPYQRRFLETFSLLAFLALVTLTVKRLLEWRYGRELALTQSAT